MNWKFDIIKTILGSLMIFCGESFALETSADEMSIDSERGVYTLVGNARAEEDGKIFKADKIVVYKKDSEKQPSKIEAFGNVSYKDDDKTITSDNCVSNMKSVTFLKNVVLSGPDFGTIHADRATYNIQNKTMDIRANKKVQLTLDKGIESEFSKKNRAK